MKSLVYYGNQMAVKRGLPLPKAMGQALALADQASVTGFAKALKVSADCGSELLTQLQAQGLVSVKTVHTGRRGRPLKRALLTPAGRRVLGLLRGEAVGVELRDRELRGLVGRALERCKGCRATEPLDETCVVVSSCAHLLGMDWDEGVPVCSCRRLPRVRKSWRELVGHA